MFKVSNKNTRTTDIALVFLLLTSTYSKTFSSVSIVDIEQVNVSWQNPHTHLLKFASRKSWVNVKLTKHGLIKVRSKPDISKLQATINFKMKLLALQ